MKLRTRMQSLWSNHKASMVSALVLLTVVPSASWLVFGYGGPPPDTSQGGTSYGPQVESWSIHRDGQTVCDHTEPCLRDDLLEAAGHGDCTWTGRVWLSGFGNPFLLRSIGTEGYAVLQETRTGSVMTSFDFDIGTTWWRALGEHVSVSMPTPCDVKVVTLAFNVKGESLAGRVVGHAGAVDTAIHGEPWEYPDS